MKAIHPKFLSKKAEVCGLEMRDVFICMCMISLMKFMNVTDLIVVGIPISYLIVKFILKIFYPRAHFFYLLKKKKYFDWSRKEKR